MTDKLRDMENKRSNILLTVESQNEGIVRIKGTFEEIMAVKLLQININLQIQEVQYI